MLVVEDEFPVRQLMRRILDARGYRVLLCAGPDEALRIQEEESRIDLAVIDIVMPRLDGPSLVKQLRLRQPSLKALFVSGYTDEAQLPAPESGRSFPFLAKPFANSVFAAKVREVLDARV